MKKIKRCDECVIGVLNCDGQTKLATVPILLDHIKRKREMRNLYTNSKAKVMFGDLVDAPTAYTLADYCTGKHTDMFRFTCCPRCGELINYREIFVKYMDV